MTDYSQLSKEQLITKIEELQTLLDTFIEEKNSQELLDFPWIGNLGSWYWYVKTNRTICNVHKILALGFSEDELPEQLGYEFFTEKLHPEDYERVMENMRDHLYGRSAAYDVTYRIRTKENTYKWFYDRGKITRRDEAGKPELVSGIVFDITEQKQMEELLEQKNQQLLELSSTDYLTGLYNRRALVEKLDYEIRRADRYQSPLSILFVDIDHFKRINDTYGHTVGDQTLRQVAEIFRKLLRNTDIAGRYGGEEFLIILPGCSQDDGFVVAEKLRSACQDFLFDSGVRLTISGGLAGYHGDALPGLVERADQCLYLAKEGGRNRIGVL